MGRYIFFRGCREGVLGDRIFVIEVMCKVEVKFDCRIFYNGGDNIYRGFY